MPHSARRSEGWSSPVWHHKRDGRLAPSFGLAFLCSRFDAKQTGVLASAVERRSRGGIPEPWTPDPFERRGIRNAQITQGRTARGRRWVRPRIPAARRARQAGRQGQQGNSLVLNLVSCVVGLARQGGNRDSAGRLSSGAGEHSIPNLSATVSRNNRRCRHAGRGIGKSAAGRHARDCPQ